jgi:hypothetical protein
MPTTRIVHGDEAYDTVWAAWVENGRPSQFDREGAFGGALYRVLDTSQEYPDFYQFASLGPTRFSDTSAAEKPTESGWAMANADGYLTERVYFDRHGNPRKVEMIDAPNKLEPEETV